MGSEDRRNPDAGRKGPGKASAASAKVGAPKPGPAKKPPTKGPGARPQGRSGASPFDAMHAAFLAEARTTGQIPAPGPLEIALAGRSNVGKSTLLNALAQRRGLARVSRTPGCTRGVILYELGLRDGRTLRVTDLPGYGYASRSHDERRGWGPLIEGYLTQRSTLGGVVILVDARRGPEQEELDLVGYLSLHGVPLLMAATKVDKLGKSEKGAALASIARKAGARVVGTSGETGEGREELLRAMLRWSASAGAPESGATSGVAAARAETDETDEPDAPSVAS